MLLIKELVFVALFVGCIKSQSHYGRIDCNSVTQLHPCRCLNDPRNVGKIDTINCTDVRVDLKLVSQELTDRLRVKHGSHKTYKIQRLEIQRTPTAQISSKVFDHVPFVEILIANNPNLDYIDRNAFNGSADTLEVFQLEDNRKLYATEHMAEDLWILLYKFVKLRELKVTGIGITSIPSHAFRSADGHRSRLKHVDLSHNMIHRIGDFAFEELASPSLDLLLNHNKISRIGKNVFRFKSSKAVIRMIDLSHNLLTPQSFDSDSFGQMGRPLATLALKENQMDSLSEDVFLPLFDRSDKNYFILEVINNHIRCDCPLQWTVKTKYCFTDKSVPVSHQIVSLKCGEQRIPVTQHDFSYCQPLTDRLSPSCQKSGLHNSAISSRHYNYQLFAFTIMSALIIVMFNLC